MTSTTPSPEGVTALVEFDPQKFWRSVDRRGPNECWPWTGSQAKRRGVIRIKGKTVTAPRIALILAGRLPESLNLFACHTCDNPNCVNPDHLWWGTNSDNLRDAASKGRLWAQRHPETCNFNSPEGRAKRPRGEQHGSSKLTVKDVLDIRQRFSAGERIVSIQARYQVHLTILYRIKNRRLWRHV